MLMRWLYKKIVTVNPEPLFGSSPNLYRFCLATRKKYSSPDMSKNINHVSTKNYQKSQVHPTPKTIS